jgi:cytochrome c oxidase subunit 2
MGTTATIIAISFTVVSVIAIVIMAAIVRTTFGKGPDEAVDVNKLGRTEKKWFVAVVVMLAVLLFATIFFTPYGRTAGKGALVEKVTAIQFAFLMPSTPIVAGRQVEFELTSRDVNHSFAVYNSAGTLLFQVQIEPGAWQDYDYTFTKPGTYTVLCLEYCGVGHDHMRAQFTVSA